MSDIVEQVREAQQGLEDNALDESFFLKPLPDSVIRHIAASAWAHRWLGEAADEIERLRAALAESEAERERLRNVLAKAHDWLAAAGHEHLDGTPSPQLQEIRNAFNELSARPDSKGDG